MISSNQVLIINQAYQIILQIVLQLTTIKITAQQIIKDQIRNQI